MDTRCFFGRMWLHRQSKPNRFLAEAHIGRLMRKYAIPRSISLLVGSLYNIVDQVFIANTYDPGSHGNAANTAVFPLTIIALAFAVMIATAAAPLSA